jgi:hypothetical protein
MATANPGFNLISSEKVEGTTVLDLSGKKIGSVDHLMIDRVNGNVRYAVMSFGEILGLGHSHYPLPWSSLNYDEGMKGYKTSVTEQQLQDAPEFSDDSWTDRDWETRIHQHYGARPYWEADTSKAGSTKPWMF